MSEHIAFVDGGKTGEEGLGKLLYYAYSAGVLGADHLEATQRGAGANMSVDVAVGGLLIDMGLDYLTHGWITATKNVTVTASNPTNDRKDILVAYRDLSVAADTLNNPDALKFMCVAGTPAGSPSDPSDGDIQTAVGGSNPFEKIARVNVDATATQITDSDIDDLRVVSRFADDFYQEIPGTSIDPGSLPASAGDANASGHGFVEIARGTGATISLTPLPAYKYLRLMWSAYVASGSPFPFFRFNNDSGGNYARVYSNSFGSATNDASATGIGMITRGNGYMDIVNIASLEKTLVAHGTDFATAGAANVPSGRTLYGKWANTSNQITRVDLVNGGTGALSSSSELIVFGKN